ncbi:membrane protein [Acrocarpospora phusangensis]|uniref:Membrane protein n=1 Tax=Acrocarpospora phusangensis TaxID=1070424 RepID=A0A919Q6Z6_9ACTN|nr:ArsB/NhaD family transporter [Acrocarpospora phusangensis]GIH23579.1 membrane protein [Acrocarpospora phusangensis]
MSVLAWASTAVFLTAYALIATEKISRVAVALGGAGIMLALHATDARAAFFAEHTGVDWNVVFLLLGMMIIVGVLKETGLFEYLAIWAAKRARGRPFRLMVLLVIITAVASALLDNVTTVLLIAPVTFLVCARLALPVAPFLISEALASNIGGAATLVGDPPNIIIASRGNLSFNDFLVHMAPMVILLMVVFIGLCWLLWGRRLRYDSVRASEIMTLDERETIADRKLLWQGLAVLAAVTAVFVLHPILGYEPSVVALLGAGVLVAVTRVTTEQALAEVEWPTLVFFAALFVMVGALVETGVIGQLSQAAVDATAGRPGLTAMGLLGGSAVLSAIVDNIPYVATMSPIVAELVNSGGGQVQWWALAFGADLGGNATAVGAAANVVILGIAARNGTPIGFWQFTKYGLIVTAVTVTLVAPYLWLRYLL